MSDISSVLVQCIDLYTKIFFNVEILNHACRISFYIKVRLI